MTDRFVAWVTLRAGEDQLRVAMALLGLFVAILWASIHLWPERWKQIGRRVFFVGGGLGYASLFTVAIYALVRALWLGR